MSEDPKVIITKEEGKVTVKDENGKQHTMCLLIHTGPGLIQHHFDDLNRKIYIGDSTKKEVFEKILAWYTNFTTRLWMANIG